MAAMATVTHVTKITHHSAINPSSIFTSCFRNSLVLVCYLVLLLSSTISPSFGLSGVGEEGENRGSDLYPEILRDEVVARLHQLGVVIAFSDEEGVRFQSTFLGSAAVAGILPVSALKITDKSDVTIQDALKKNSIEITEENLLQLKYDPKSVWGYVEIHIEQGPVLEWVGVPLAVVKGIAGQTRLKNFSFSMESLSTSLVCTVGEISTWPSASNVIPGQVTFSEDLRTIDDMGREAVVYEFSNRMYQICDKRSVSCTIDRKHDADAVICDSELSSKLKSATYIGLKRMTGGAIQDEIPVVMSGAGHDAMALSHLTKVGMLFVRCRGGISHSPEEHVLDVDVWASGLAILAFIETQM